MMKKFIPLFIFLPLLSFGQSPEPPIFSHETGFYNEEFDLRLSHPDSSVMILYTTDGSRPVLENKEGKIWTFKKSYPTYPEDDFGELFRDTLMTFLYQSPLRITNRDTDPDRYADIASSFYINDYYRAVAQLDSVSVFKGFPVRAAAYKNGEYSEIITRNYFVSRQGKKRYNLPVMCLTAEPDELFGYEKGWNIPGKQFDDWRKEKPSEEPHLWAPANYHDRGSETELEIHFNYLADGKEILNHGAGLRANGNSSRIYPNRSLRLYAKKGYGPKNFEYPFFGEAFGSSFKRLILRNSGQDTEETMLRDPLIHQATQKLNFDTQGYQPVVLFINGEYWGIYNLRERYDKKYFERKHGIEEEDLDFIKSGEVKEGDDADLKALFDFLEKNSLSDPEHYQRVTEWIDVENFIDYYAVQIFAGNVDWPQSNTEYWRKRTPYDSTAPYGQDGRWRVVLKDLDYSLGKRWEGYSYKSKDLERVTTLSPDNPNFNNATLVIRSLLENATFKEQFISRFADILNSTLRSDVLISEFWKIHQKLLPEIEEFIYRWNPTMENLLPWHPVFSFGEWARRTGEVTEFAKKRPGILHDHLQDRFEIGKRNDIHLKISEPGAGYIRINTLDIKSGTDGVTSHQPYPWKGTYFENIPVTLTAFPNEKYGFSHWSDHNGNIIDTARTISFLPSHGRNITAHFYEGPPPNTELPEGEWVSVYPNPFSDIFYIIMDQYEGRYTLYSMEGHMIIQNDLLIPRITTGHLAPGMYILRIESGDRVAVKKIMKF